MDFFVVIQGMVVHMDLMQNYSKYSSLIEMNMSRVTELSSPSDVNQRGFAGCILLLPCSL